jgi:aminomethyltransferase
MTGAHWLDLSARGKIKMLGEDRARLLHAMSTNHIQQLKPGEGCYTFFLNAQGRILGDAHVLCFDDHFLLDTEPETREKLYEHLDKYIIADDVTLEDTTSTLATIAVEGTGAGAMLGAVPETPFHWVAWKDRIVLNASYTGEGFFVIVPLDQRQSLIAELESAGAIPANLPDFELARLENGKPRYGEEITERYLLQETGQMHAVHFSKGCYLGQEIVERIRSRAQIHRILMPLRINSKIAPSAGEKLLVDGQPAAEISSAAYSPALDQVAALAYVRTQFAKPGAILMWGEARAEVGEPFSPIESYRASE